MPEPSSPAALVEEQLKALTAPLEAQLVSIDADLDRVDQEMKTLIGARRRIVSVLTQLTPMAERKSLSRNGNTNAKRNGHNTASGRRPPVQPPGRSVAEKRGRIRDYLLEHKDEPVFANGFTGTTVYEEMRRTNPPGEEVVGLNAALQVVRELHDQGVLVLDRIVRGGAHQYRIVGGPS